MKDLQRIKKMIADHYDGSPWIDVNITDTLRDVNAVQASQKIGSLNSIWQIVHHMISWRETLLKRINNKVCPSSGNNFIVDIEDTSEKAWKQLLKKLEKSQKAILIYLSNKSAMDLDEKILTSVHSRYELIHAIIQHDCYHLGQVVLIKKMISV